MSLSQIVALLCLLLWALLTYVRPVGLGIVHVLLVLGFMLWIRGWALRGSQESEVRRK